MCFIIIIAMATFFLYWSMVASVASALLCGPPLSIERMQFFLSSEGQILFNKIMDAAGDYLTEMGIETAPPGIIQHLQEESMHVVIKDASLDTWVGFDDQEVHIIDFGRKLIEYAFEEQRSDVYISQVDFNNIIVDNHDSIMTASRDNMSVNILWRQVFEYRGVVFPFFCIPCQT